MNTGALLQVLQQQVQQLAESIANTPATAAMQPRFDSQLFNQRDSRLSHYLTEVEKNLIQLKQEVENQRQQQVAFLAERIVAQITALQRELATLKIREQNTTVVKSSSDIYQTLAQHQDYERRLQEMLRDKEHQLIQQTTLTAQQQIQKELAALEGRLMRCRQALKRIEKQIERRETGM
ncbi:primosomal replication protein PriC [Pragia fontium]|uniref:Restart primosome assembly protein PriC n=2 Tax=Pragia fontium TaxID=82985 RepID=A0AAJ4W8U9_9GAMM|nr:primosomal replication protein [Pragia fontium]AKJ41706.1 prephenate dehydrogenase [Pragia fontium]SFC34195.1 restart primosome assembly protein PriC [Pragia fontium DSM 5563 = ATCC 49100]SUB81933.1 Primosomal replication protein N'' [Pragia fontium]VEJ54511.1 Primosomal replication protein N'' [Pragia fontium]GKX62211.1 prephenate dehydrogenase [Pragia fontium]